MRNPAKPKHLKHEGKLLYGSLLARLPRGLFGPSESTLKDPHGLGWAIGNVGQTTEIQFSNILYASAEAVIALAMIEHSLARTSRHRPLRTSFDDLTSTRSWIDALHLDQLWSAKKPKPEDLVWGRPADCFAHPLAISGLSTEKDAGDFAAQVVNAIATLPDWVLPEGREELIASVERVAHEVALNIFQHAYQEKEIRHAYACATVTPAGQYAEMTGIDGISVAAEEHDWLRENERNLILEIAIGDSGQGIPITLWHNAFEKKRDFAQRWNQARMSIESRAVAHHDLCAYAFHYASTCKQDSDFPNPASRLSWRGLHKCLRQAEYLRGTIIIASGQGRAGYAFVGDQMRALSPLRNRSAELPGTMVVLRFPATFGAMKKHERRQQGADRAILRILQNGNEEHAQSSADAVPAIVSGENATGRPLAVPVLFPFTEISRVEELLERLLEIPHDKLAFIMFCKVPDPIVIELRAYTAEWSEVRDGLPRLLCLWDPHTNLLAWKIGGPLPLPSAGLKLYSDLEMMGSADLSLESDHVHNLARQLSRTYPDCLIWDEASKCLDFVAVSAALSQKDYEDLLSRAVEDLIASAPADFLFIAPSNVAIRLPTGRLVKRFVSVCSMLRTRPVLVHALHHRLMQILRSLGQPSEIWLVTDSTASSMVARQLLQGIGEIGRLMTFPQALAEGGAPSVLAIFVDAIYRGETVARLARQLKRLKPSRCVVVPCIDMRAVSWPVEPMSGWDVLPLVHAYFDPVELKALEAPEHIWEIDTTSHVPYDRHSEYALLTRDERRLAFLVDHPEVFAIGIHTVAGRVHSISLDTSVLVRDHRENVISWLTETLIESLSHIKGVTHKQNLVVFSPNERDGFLSGLTEAIALHLKQRTRRFKSAWVVPLPSTNHSAKPVFPRPDENLFSLAFEAPRSLFTRSFDGSSVGVFLDDASLSGKTMQHFITSALTPPNPALTALIAVVLVNRLSPREARFYGICGNLQSLASEVPSSRNIKLRTRNVPFRLSWLFQLQVKSADVREQGGLQDIVAELEDSRSYADQRLDAYLTRIRDNINQSFRQYPKKGEARVCLQHPFFPDATEPSPPSLRAVRIRHLLSLRQQNEGVLSELLAEIEGALGDLDSSVLVLFAIEPYLLREDVLPNDCLIMIKELSERVVRRDLPASTKSNALAILGLLSSSDFAALIPSTTNHDQLVTQVAAFMLRASRYDRSILDTAPMFLEEAARSGDAPNLEWLRTTLALPKALHGTLSVSDELTAVAHIHDLVARSWPHLGPKAWTKFDGKVKDLSEDSIAPDETFLSDGNECMAYAESVLLPALAAVLFLGRQRLPITDTQLISHSLVEAFHAHRRLESLLARRDQLSSGIWKKETIEQWNHLRQSTLKGGSPASILGKMEDTSSHPSDLEVFLPRLFCSPVTLLANAAYEVMGTMEMITPPIGYDNCVLLVPVPRQIVYDAVRILLENTRKHADVASSRYVCDVSRNPAATGQRLKIECRDTPRADRHSGDQMGLPLLDEYSRRYRFEFSRSDSSAEFIASLTFGDALIVSPEMP